MDTRWPIVRLAPFPARDRARLRQNAARADTRNEHCVLCRCFRPPCSVSMLVLCVNMNNPWPPVDSLAARDWTV